MAGDTGETLYRYRFGDVEFDEARFELHAAGLAVDVQVKPLELLRVLLRAGGEVVSRAQILRSVWKYQNPALVDTNVVGAALTKLREALGKDAQRIVNVPRMGYRLDGPIHRDEVGHAGAPPFEGGMPVPRREEFVLEQLLSRSKQSEVWRARSAQTGESRVYKFAPDGSQLPVLKKEAALLRVLRETLSGRPDFVRLADWNFTQAPFFLELEDGGQNLAEWAADGGRLRALAGSQRLALFLQIADAVAAAHHIGILHRDLAPANLLVAPKVGGWQPRLIDFGSGQVLEPEQLIELGITPFEPLAAGAHEQGGGTTPLYLAPEIIAGQPLTVRSDIYALGILLYQLIIGDLTKPWAQGWERDIADELLREDISAATDGDPALRLASVVELVDRLRGLEKRRAERAHQRAAEQAARAAHEALKRSRARRPWLIASVVTLVAGLSVSVWLYRAESVARQKAESETARAETINGFLNDDLIGAADPIAPGQQNDPTITVVLARAAMRLNDRFGSAPFTKGTIELAIGKAYFGLANYASAEVHQRRALELLTQASGPADVHTLEASYVLTRTLMQLTRFPEAEDLLATADKNAGRRLLENSSLALLARWTRGGLGYMRQQPAEALAHFEAAEKIRLQVDPENESWLFKLHGNIAWALNRLHREQEAAYMLRDLVRPENTPDRSGLLDWSKAQFEYGTALMGLGKFDEAISVTVHALDQIQQALGSDHYVTGIVWDHLAAAFQAAGRWDQALDAAQHAYRIMQQRVGAKGRAALGAYSRVGALTFYAGNVDEGLRMLREARLGLTEILGSQAPLTQINDYYLADALNNTGKLQEAYALIKKLHPVALTSAEPGSDWEEHLMQLKMQILRRYGPGAEAALQKIDD